MRRCTWLDRLIVAFGIAAAIVLVPIWLPALVIYGLLADLRQDAYDDPEW